jgi:membrane protein DedA with SNARE-associated domain
VVFPDHALASGPGYAIAFAGTLVEGETMLVAASLASRHGYLSLPAVMLCGWLGGVSGDFIDSGNPPEEDAPLHVTEI